MEAISGRTFMELVRLGFSLVPQEDDEHIGVDLGRAQFVCAVADLTAQEGQWLEKMYREGVYPATRCR